MATEKTLFAMPETAIGEIGDKICKELISYTPDFVIFYLDLYQLKILLFCRDFIS